jgi:hypothetical protein
MENHKTLAWFKPPNVYTGGAALMQTKVRQADVFGILLDVVGVVLLLVGFWKIIARLWFDTGVCLP